MIAIGTATPSQPKPPASIIRNAAMPARMNPRPRTTVPATEPGSTRSASFNASSRVGGATSTGPPTRAMTTACSSSRIRAFAASLACASSAAADTAVSAAVAASPITSSSWCDPVRWPPARSSASRTRRVARSARREARSARSRALRISRLSNGSVYQPRVHSGGEGGGAAGCWGCAAGSSGGPPGARGGSVVMVSRCAISSNGASVPSEARRVPVSRGKTTTVAGQGSFTARRARRTMRARTGRRSSGAAASG